MLVFSPGGLSLGLFCPFLANEPLQLPLPDESFYLLLQVKAFGRVVAVIVMETAVLVSRPLAEVSLQLAKECQGPFVLDLHQDLIDRGVQGGEAYESSYRRLGASILPFISCPGHLSLLVLPGFLLSFSLFRLLFMSQQCVFHVHVFSSLVDHIQHGFRVSLIQGK